MVKRKLPTASPGFKKRKVQKTHKRRMAADDEEKPEKPKRMSLEKRVRMKNAAKKKAKNMQKEKPYLAEVIEKEQKKKKNFKKQISKAALHLMTPKERKTFWRKLKQGDFDTRMQVKLIWQKLIRHDVSKEERTKLCDDLFVKILGHVKELISSHDTSRALEALVKWGSDSQRDAVLTEIRDYVVDLAKSKYSKHNLVGLFKHGSPQQRQLLLMSFKGHVNELLRHSVAANVVETAYCHHSNKFQRNLLLTEVYGPKVALLFAQTNDPETVDSLMQRHTGEQRDGIVLQMYNALTVIVKKDVLGFSIVHKALLDFFKYAGGHLKSEMIESLCPRVFDLLSSRDGTQVALECIWGCTTKERRVILKALRGQVTDACKKQYGHYALMALFDVVDDTHWIEKYLLKEIQSDIVNLAQHPVALKVLLYLLSPRDPQYFAPDVVSLLLRGDENKTSLIPREQRYPVLKSAISPCLLDLLQANPNLMFLSNNKISLLAVAIVTHAKGDRGDAIESLAQLASEPYSPPCPDHIIEHPVGHQTLRKLVQSDKMPVAGDDNTQRAAFCPEFLEHLSDETLISWTTSNIGCFTLLRLIESASSCNEQATLKRLVSIVKLSQKHLRTTEGDGAKFLLQKLNSA